MSRFLASLTLAGLVWLGAVLQALEADAVREYQIKAAFLYNVMKFVVWPDSAMSVGEGPVSVAVLGTNAASDMETILGARLLKGRRIAVKGYSQAKDLGPCHVLFVTADALGEQREALRAVAGHSVLTVTEGPNLGTPAAVISLAIVETKLTFHVNLDAAESHGLQLSSNLLGLAKSRSEERRVGKECRL